MEDILFSSWGGEVVDNRGKLAGSFDPVNKVDFPEYFQQGEKIKALVGWHGLVLRSTAVNVIELCFEHMKFVQNSSCGKCFPCRVGSKVMASVLGRISEGKGCENDLNILRDLGASIKESSKCGIGQSGPVPVLHALQYFEKEFLEAVKNSSQLPKGEYSYSSKLTAPCMDACPIHLDIPAYVECIGEGYFQKSLDIIREKLPIPGVVGRVCVRPCEAKCRRGLMDGPISIKYLKRFAADYELSRNNQKDYPVRPSLKTGKFAIVGAGPSGVTCAYHLAQKGHSVVIYEALEEPGGMAAVGIPDYRLPRHILRDEVKQIQKMGVDIKYGVRVGTDITLDQLEKDNDAVFIAIGAHLSLNMGVQGEKEGYKGFISGVQYLKDINEGRDPYPEGKKVVVIGGGNVAIDCIRTSYRVKKTDVNLVYRRTKKEMPADPVEIRDAEEEGVNFLYLTNPTRVIAENGKVVGIECIRMELGEPDASGRRRPVPVEGSEFIIDCDIVVPAIGQAIDLSLLKGSTDIKTTRWNSIEVNEFTKQTSEPKIFSGGDCATGIGALITACAAGRTAAINMDRLINGLPSVMTEEDCFDTFFRKVKIFDPKESTGLLGGCPGHHLTMLPPEERKYNFDEVEQGFSVQEAMAEASRCLRCYRVATLAIDGAQKP